LKLLTILLTILCLYISNVQAQDDASSIPSEKTPAKISHSILAVSTTDLHYLPSIGILYDYRIRTPAAKSDWSLQLATTYSYTSGNLVYNYFPIDTSLRLPYEKSVLAGAFQILHLSGKKEITFDKGISIQYIRIKNDAYEVHNADYSADYTGKTVESYLNIGIPLGLRAQAFKNGFFMSAYMIPMGSLRNTGWEFNIGAQIAAGYTF
jgi:hypothetical protein